MRRWVWVLIIALGCLSAVPLPAQKEKREPLTGPQIEEIREAEIYPDDRVALWKRSLLKALKGEV